MDDIASKLVNARTEQENQSPPLKKKLHAEVDDKPSTSKMQVISDEEHMRNLFVECNEKNEVPCEDAEGSNSEKAKKENVELVQYEEDLPQEEQRR
uniref:Ovule protein n=1 Tax=Haemonchus contortus TaxID=6289 RepID=A0A7I4YV31_HAECO